VFALKKATSSITVANTASTTHLIISGSQTGGTWTYTSSTTVFSVVSTAVNVSIPSEANFGIIKATMNDSGAFFRGTLTFARKGITDVDFVLTLAGLVGQDGDYSFSWSGNTLTITENSDNNSDSSVSGTIYWYK